MARLPRERITQWHIFAVSVGEFPLQSIATPARAPLFVSLLLSLSLSLSPRDQQPRESWCMFARRQCPLLRRVLIAARILFAEGRKKRADLNWNRLRALIADKYSRIKCQRFGTAVVDRESSRVAPAAPAALDS